MKFSLDVNVALKTVLKEADSDLARALINDYMAGIHELIARTRFPSKPPTSSRELSVKASSPTLRT